MSARVRPLFDDSEIVPAPAVPGLVERLLATFDSISPSVASTLRVVDPAHGDRLGVLAQVLLPQSADPRWSSDVLLDVFTQEMDNAAIRQALAAVPFEQSSPVYVWTDLWGAPDDAGPGEITLATNWAFYAEHIAPVPVAVASQAAPPDCSWILRNHYGEFITIFRTRLHAVREIVFYGRFQLRDGSTAPKPQYVVQFADGGQWISGNLRDPKLRSEHEGAMLLVSAMTGLAIQRREVLPFGPARPAR